jgi:hypothetical protein
MSITQTDHKAEALASLAWMDATAELRQDIFTKAYDRELARLTKAREKAGKKVTETQRNEARNLAQAEVIKAMYALPEYNGVRNPMQDDLEWGPNRVETPAAPKVEKEDLTELVEWLAAQTWSSFAVSLATQYSERKSLSPKQIEAAKSMKAKSDARQTKPEGKETGLDISTLPSGYYAVPGGDTRLKVRVAHGKPGSKWDGFTFVSDGAEYGQRKNYGMQKPGAEYRGEIKEALAAILANPLEAMKAYGRLIGRCGHCNRILEDESSIEAGIGPICAQNWAA